MYKKGFYIGEKRKRNQEYRAVSKKLCEARNLLRARWKRLSDGERKTWQKSIRGLEKELLQQQPTQPQDETYRRLQYVRYASTSFTYTITCPNLSIIAASCFLILDVDSIIVPLSQGRIRMYYVETGIRSLLGCVDNRNMI